MTLPLLIGGATTSRAHTAVRLEPAYSGPVVHVQDASRAVGVAGALLDADARDAFVGADARRVRGAARQFARPRRPNEQRLTHRRGAREPRADRLGRRSCRRGRPSSARARSPTSRSRSSSSASTGRRSSPPGSCPATTRRSSTTRWSGAAARALFDDAQELLERVVDRATDPRRRRRRLLAGERDRRRRHRALHRRVAGDRARRAVTPCASRWPSRRVGRTSRCRTTSRRSRSGVADYVGAFAVTAGGGAGRARAPSSRRPATTTRRSCSRRWPTGWPRRSPSGCTSRCAASCGATRRTRRSTTTRSSPSVPGHPAGARLSGAARPHREAHDLPAARRGGAGRHHLTESMAMVPGASVSGLYFWHPGGALLRPRPDRPRPARRLRAAQGLVARRSRALARAEPRRRRGGRGGGRLVDGRSRARFADRLAAGPLLADGAMGTLLFSRGVPQRACLDELVATRPDLIGADPSRVPRGRCRPDRDGDTFGANRHRLAPFGLADRAAPLNRRAAPARPRGARRGRARRRSSPGRSGRSAPPTAGAGAAARGGGPGGVPRADRRPARGRRRPLRVRDVLATSTIC